MSTMNDASNQHQPTEFELRRAEIVGQIGEISVSVAAELTRPLKSLEQVLTQVNALNRSLESIIELGNEFASVEALWSQFEAVMDSQKALNAEADAEQQGPGAQSGESNPR